MKKPKLTPDEIAILTTAELCDARDRVLLDRLLDEHKARGERIAELERQRESTVRALQAIVRNDATSYQHHEPRRWDGRTPDADGGTIWLTPREIARQMLTLLGAEVPDAFAELRASVAAVREERGA